MKIFVSIACFMDKDIENTVKDCLDKAENPDNIVFGICLQEDPEEQLLTEYNNNKQFKIHRIHWKQAQGPTYARYLVSKLLTNEDYYLQIDCHTRFFDKWDKIALECLEECNDDKAIITNFPIGIPNMDKYLEHPLNKSTKIFNSLSMESIKLGSVCANYNKDINYKTYYLSGALIFGKSDFLKEVKYDPVLTYSYQTIEQQFYAIRLFTYGWNIYMPSKHILATSYKSSIHYDKNNNRIYAPSNISRGKLSWERVLYYYGLKNINEISNEITENIDLYGFGKVRTFNDFLKIHGEEDCIEKLKSGLKYNKGKWYKYNYKCKNSILTNVLNSNNFIQEDKDKSVDFEWNIKPLNYNNHFQHYTMSDVSFIDNKLAFFKLLTINNIQNIPKTYFNVNDIKELNNCNMFLKYAGNNGGKNVFLYNNIADLTNHTSNDPRPYIIQEEVPNMLLIDNKKFVLRNWIVIVDNKFYITSNGCCIIHEHEYDKNSKDRKIHIEHDLSKNKYINYNLQSFYKESMKKVCLLNTKICNAIKNKLNFKKNCYQVLGLDIIFDTEFNPYVIEFNSWPNMSVPYGLYKNILQEFFTNFLNDIIINKLNNQPIIDTDYFTELICN
jgi:hypothetical protein